MTENKIILTKESSESDIKSYFTAVLSLITKQQKRIERLQKRIKQQAKEIHCKDKEIIEMYSIITSMPPEPSYLGVISGCKEAVNISTIAQDYGMSAEAFNVLLGELNLQYKIDQTWAISPEYIVKGYVKSETLACSNSDGTTGERVNVKWTQRGRLFLYESLKQHGILPLIEQPNKQQEKV